MAVLGVLMFLLAGAVTACSSTDTPPTTVKPTATTRPATATPSPTASATSTPTPGPQVLPGDWPSYLLGGSNFNGNETAITAATASSLTRSWTSHAGGGISSQPVVVDGTVYWGSWDGYEHATSLQGVQRWTANLGKTNSPQCYPPIAGVASTSTVALVNIAGKQTLVVFVGGGTASFYALNAANGRVIWKTLLDPSVGAFIWDSPVVYHGSVYIGTASVGECPGTQGRFFRLNATTGTVERVFNVVPVGCHGGGVWGSPTIDTRTGNLYIATGNSAACGAAEPYAMAMVELRADSLSVVGAWQVPGAEAAADGDFGSTPTLFTAIRGGVSQMLVGAVNKNGTFYAFRREAVSAGPVWRAHISTPLNGCGVCPSGDIAPAAWDGHTLYVGSTSTSIGGKFCYGSIRALDPATGKYLWQHCLSSAYRVLAGVTAIPGLVAVAVGTQVVIVDATNGATRFSYHDTSKDSTFDGAPTIAHGVMYVGNLDGTLYAFAPPAQPT
ncbi:MAG TPA: PQQ-binding-like beta-propeller repeat protein [Ktedonobacteraceae bacterium]|nr:PQQ-binding-like beta-propeller repeat protein [Ktedonobacteraceae bacterium]